MCIEPLECWRENNAPEFIDIVRFFHPAAVYEDQAIDHREIYEECQRRHGKAHEFIIKGTFNPKTRKIFRFLVPPMHRVRSTIVKTCGTLWV